MNVIMIHLKILNNPIIQYARSYSKIIVLFIIGVVFCIASTVAMSEVLVGMFTLDVYGLGYKIFLAVETGIFTIQEHYH